MEARRLLLVPGSSCPALRSEGMILGGEGGFQQPLGSRQTCPLQGHPPDPKPTQGSHSTPAHTEASLTQVLRPGHPQDGAANALNTSGSGFQSPSLRPQAGAYSPGPAGHEPVKQTKVCVSPQHEHTIGTMCAHICTRTHTLSSSPLSINLLRNIIMPTLEIRKQA